ncbi:hypothetical protein HII12_001719 [Brettanomyces bruxellensis]|uniref:Protein CMS1 n=1 Tax=Dekkera bruxellensis TaxID=5007 RepID=A0A8H6BKA0_DEKBR|nr:hypothetical protein HII12_001719 [Brettanomyces bruxellensis]
MTGEDDLNDGLDYKFEASEDEGVSVPKENEDQSDNEQKTEQKEEEKKFKSNKRKNTDKEKLKEKKKRKLEYDTAEKKNIATQTADIIAEKLAQKVKRQNKKLSALELSDLYISKSNIAYTGDWKEERTLKNLPSFLENFIENDVLSKSPKRLRAEAKKAGKKDVKPEEKKGKPARHEHCYALVISMSAIRACDVHRATRSMEAGSMKLISKNRLKDDIKNLKSSRCRILAGTPGRIKRILEVEKSPLKGTEIKAVICDCYLDSKLQNLWDTPDTIRTLRKIIDGNKDVRIYLY